MTGSPETVRGMLEEFVAVVVGAMNPETPVLRQACLGAVTAAIR